MFPTSTQLTIVTNIHQHHCLTRATGPFFIVPLLFYFFLVLFFWKVVRRFIHPPHGATWMDVEVKDCREASAAPDGTRFVFVTLLKLGL